MVTRPGGEAIREERKLVTALSADVVASTSIGEQFDPEDVMDIVGGAVALMVHVVEDFGGTVKDLAGDGILALFGAPVAHEDDAERAVLAGLGIVDAMREHAVHVLETWGLAGLSVRVGIATSVVVVGPVGSGQRVEYGAVGDAVNTASRLQASAAPGTILVGASTRRPVERVFEWGEAQRLTLKGKSGPVVAYRAVAARRDRGGPGPDRAPPLVARDEEMASLHSVASALRSGRGGVVFITGEPGIGKSRMVAELRAELESNDPRLGGLWMEGRCVSYGQALPFWPYIALLREWLIDSVGDPGIRAQAALPSVLEALMGRRSEEVRPFLATLLWPGEGEADLASLPPAEFQRRTFEAVRTLIAALASKGPVVLAIEDLHWADPTSMMLSERLISVAASAPLLMVFTQRPDSDRDAGSLREEAQHWLSGRVHELALGPIPLESSDELLMSSVGAGTLPEEVRERILARADGNPFYLEEIVRSLADAGALVFGSAEWRFEHDAPLDIPNSIEKVIAARIDLLPLGSRDALVAASVLGLEFEVLLLQAVSRLGDALAQQLVEPVRVRLIDELTRATARSLRFHHALIQEVAYRSLLRRTRRELHLRAALAIEEAFGDRLEEQAGILAHHYQEASELAAAFRYRVMAGDASRRVYAVREALDHYTGALEVAVSLGEVANPPVGDVLMRRGRVLLEMGHAAGARDDFQQALDLAKQLGDRRTEMLALDELGFVLAGEADYRAALPHLTAASTIAEELSDIGSLVRVLSHISLVHMNQLSFDHAMEGTERALELAQQLGEEQVLATVLDAIKQLALDLGEFGVLRDVTDQLDGILRRRGDLWHLQFVIFESSFIRIAAADWQGAIALIQKGLALNRQIEDRGNEPLYLLALGWVHRSRGSYGDALAMGRASLDLASELGHAEWMSFSAAHLGWTLQELFAFDEAHDVLQRGVESGDRAGALNHLILCTSFLAWVRWQQGNREGAQEMLGRADGLLARVATPPGRAFLLGGQAYVAVAQVHLATGNAERAEDVIRPFLAAAEAAGWREHVARGSLVLGLCREAAGDRSAGASLLSRALEIADANELKGVALWAHIALAGLGRNTASFGDVPAHQKEADRILRGLSSSVGDETIRHRFLASVGSSILAGQDG